MENDFKSEIGLHGAIEGDRPDTPVCLPWPWASPPGSYSRFCPPFIPTEKKEKKLSLFSVPPADSSGGTLKTLSQKTQESVQRDSPGEN